MSGVAKKVESPLNFKVVLFHFGSGVLNNVVMPVKEKGLDAAHLR